MVVVVINDGSNESYSEIWDSLTNITNVTVVHQEKNQGKGSALKRGVEEMVALDVCAMVTADADGQHNAEDVLAVLLRSARSGEVVLGVRELSGKVTPWKSRFGNAVTGLLFTALTKMRVKDTQTGMRGFPADVFSLLLSTEGEKYDYELNVLMALANTRSIVEIPIETRYFNHNQGTYFRPVIDSALVYLIFVRYSLVALGISVLDFFAIWLLSMQMNASNAFILVRLITVHLYFYLMKKRVFGRVGDTAYQLCKYYLLILFNISLSYWVFDGVYWAFESGFVFSYFVAGLAMFVFNFYVTQKLIFDGQ